MTYYLQSNTLARSQYRVGRREQPSGAIVIHTAEIAPDTIGLDSAAERIAEFMTRRTDPGSYHRLVDSDSIVSLVDFSNEAFHEGTGGNKWSIGLSVATQAHRWGSTPQAWRDATITNLAQAAAEANGWLVAHGYPGCPPTRISNAEYRTIRKPGFISHGWVDPTRRTDPGADFPWAQFLAEYVRLTTPSEDQMITDILAAYTIGGRTPTPAEVKSWLPDLKAKQAKGEDLEGTYLWIADTVYQEGNPS